MQLTLEKILILKQIPLFSDVPEPSLADFVSSSEEFSVVAGADLIRKNTVWQDMFVLLQGQIRIAQDAHILADLSNHAVFGEIYALAPQQTDLTVTALEDSTLFRISGEALYQLMYEHKSIAKGIITNMCKRIRQESATFF